MAKLNYSLKNPMRMQHRRIYIWMMRIIAHATSRIARIVGARSSGVHRHTTDRLGSIKSAVRRMGGTAANGGRMRGPGTMHSRVAIANHGRGCA